MDVDDTGPNTPPTDDTSDHTSALYRTQPGIPDRSSAADDTAVIQENEPPGRFVFAPLPGSFIPEGDPTGPYDGAFGLGRQFALGAAVRPFRKLISAQAVFRREAFE